MTRWYVLSGGDDVGEAQAAIEQHGVVVGPLRAVAAPDGRRVYATAEVSCACGDPACRPRTVTLGFVPENPHYIGAGR